MSEENEYYTPDFQDETFDEEAFNNADVDETDAYVDYESDPLNIQGIPNEAWQADEKFDLKTATNQAKQTEMIELLEYIQTLVTTHNQDGTPFHTLAIFLAKNGENEEDTEQGVHRLYGTVGHQDYATDLAMQFAIENTQNYLKAAKEQHDMPDEEYQKLSQGYAFTMIKRVIDAFDLKDESIDLNALKGDLADVVKITNSKGEEMDL